ncbi:MMPL family transporter [Trujillonella endophytica]|uniref:Putative drug exporter of the RND superfamily n=1 Tax=Trujillonella endophytica TaxID=673521 RepID=A0A1H8WE49_9ACTN|nr:MMPL family transporter [Trujillella endophytica]SEP25911.1 putative drug exporter of the RND superfamily [Trujillella endophytica]
MAVFLHRLGRWAFHRRKTVLFAWVAALIGLGALAGAFGKDADAQLSIPGVESVTALETLDERFPESGAAGASARVVFAAPEGGAITDPAYRAAVEQALAEAAAAEQVAAVTDPFERQGVSPDGRVAYATVSYDAQIDEITDTAREELLAVADAAEDAGLQVEFGGEATQAVAAQGAAEALGVLVAMLVLAVTFGSLLAAGLPLLTAIIGVGAGMAGVLALSSVVDLTSTTPTLGLMIGLAVGIDYALFIAIRHKEQLAAGVDARESAGRAVGTAGSAVVFAGLTVMIALAGLTVVGIPFLTTMGLVAAGMVGVAVLVALTLVPAMLGFAGDRFDRWAVPGLRRRQAALATKDSAGTRWARWVTRRPLPVLLVGAVGLGVVALPALDLRLGLPTEGDLGTETTQRQAYDLLAGAFGPGFNGPLTVLVDATDAADPEAAFAATAAAVGDLDGVATVAQPQPNDAGDTAILAVIPDAGPADAGTEQLVHDIRDLRPGLTDDTGSELAVTGNTALGIDISEKLGAALPVFLLVVVGLAILLLMLAFRSILVPIKAVLGFLLSLAATFGALVAVFQWGWLAELIGVEQTGPVLSFLPILLIGLLFGLAMDYEVFLVSRMREEHVHGAAPTEAVIGGFRHGARVVTAAALIMGSVFAGFILGDDATVKSIGFALAFGVLVDAFVVRMAIVPAVMTLLGRRAWYLPRWLDRALPDVDIEGSALERRTAAVPDGELVAAQR